MASLPMARLPAPGAAVDGLVVATAAEIGMAVVMTGAGVAAMVTGTVALAVPIMSRWVAGIASVRGIGTVGIGIVDGMTVIAIPGSAGMKGMLVMMIPGSGGGISRRTVRCGHGLSKGGPVLRPSHPSILLFSHIEGKLGKKQDWSMLQTSTFRSLRTKRNHMGKLLAHTRTAASTTSFGLVMVRVSFAFLWIFLRQRCQFAELVTPDATGHLGLLARTTLLVPASALFSSVASTLFLLMPQKCVQALTRDNSWGRFKLSPCRAGYGWV